MPFSRPRRAYAQVHNHAVDPSRRPGATGFQAQQAGHAADAEAAYQAALALHPGEPNAWQLLGRLAGKRGDQPGVEHCLRRSLQAQSDQPHVSNNLGKVLDRTQRRDEAERCYARAVALAGNYTNALYNLARLKHARGAAQAAVTLQSALATLDEALHISPARAALHHNRAVVLQRQHRPALALQAHEQALAMGADTADVHYNRGNTLHSLGRPAEAAASYRQALQRDAAHALALVDLARLRWSQGDADFDAALRQAGRKRPASWPRSTSRPRPSGCWPGGCVATRRRPRSRPRPCAMWTVLCTSSTCHRPPGGLISAASTPPWRANCARCTAPARLPSTRLCAAARRPWAISSSRVTHWSMH